MAENNNGLSPGWLVAGGFLLLVVVAALVVVFFPADDDEREPEADTTTENSETTNAAEPDLPGEDETTTGSEETGSVEACDLDEADSDFPASAPEFTWEEHPSGVVLPVSEEHGPAVRQDAFWRCTSQTPTGAAFAGASLFVAFGEDEEAAVADSPRARSLLEEGDPFGVGDPDVIVRGFQIISSSEEAATVDYWMESDTDDSLVLSVELTLVWDEDANDWRLDLSEGDLNFTVPEDTSTYTEWR